jgi:tetraacyldisaccharide 4'-kinase
MTNTLRYLLLSPLSAIYGLIISIRNSLYNKGLIPSREHPLAIISIGNLTVGGTGKTPHAEFILSELQSLFRIALLSRGYKRKTKGFVLAGPDSDYREIGDEPCQMAMRFPGIPVAVCENRNKGIEMLRSRYPKLDAILLDDAFQHRSVRAGLSILLTDYQHLYTRDYLLPGGNLRESKTGSKRADIIVITKCPPDLKPIDMRLLQHEINPAIHQQLFFSSFSYDEPFPLRLTGNESMVYYRDMKEKKMSALLLTGIVNPDLLREHLSQYCNEIVGLRFPDHHDYNRKDALLIEKKFAEIKNPEKLILTTAKDAARLINNKYLSDKLKNNIFVIPVRIQILDNKETAFIQKITDYVTENSGNR